MKLLGIFIRFLLYYILFAVGSGIALFLLEMKMNSAVTVFILYGATTLSCNNFCKKNDRYFNKTEKRNVVIGFVLINATIRFGVAWVFNQLVSPQVKLIISIVWIFEVGIIHSLIIYFFVRSARKRFEVEKRKAVYKNLNCIFTTEDYSEALALKDNLETHGFDCVVNSESPSGINVLFSTQKNTQSTLWIDKTEENIEEAKKIIRDYETSQKKRNEP